MIQGMRFLFFLAIAFFPSLSFAGGSVTWKEVQAVLAKKPNLKELIESTFEIEKDGEAIRLGRQFENLGGLRIAPYRFKATAKDGSIFLVTVNSEKTFVLEDGTKLDTGDERMFKAAKLIEVPTGFSVETEPDPPASE